MNYESFVAIRNETELKYFWYLWSMLILLRASKYLLWLKDLEFILILNACYRFNFLICHEHIVIYLVFIDFTNFIEQFVAKEIFKRETGYILRSTRERLHHCLII